METMEFEYQGKRVRVYLDDFSGLYVDAFDLEELLGVTRGSLDSIAEYFEQEQDHQLVSIHAIDEASLASFEQVIRHLPKKAYFRFKSWLFAQTSIAVRQTIADTNYGKGKLDARPELKELRQEVSRLNDKLKEAREYTRIILHQMVETAAKNGELGRCLISCTGMFKELAVMYGEKHTVLAKLQVAIDQVLTQNSLVQENTR